MSAAAAPEPAPVHQPEPPYVVRLRILTHSWSSEAMTRVDAETLQATVTQQLSDIGDSARFITFAGRDGKLLEIRGREVIAVLVELEESTRRGGPSRRPGSAVSGGELHIYGGQPPAGDGTAWLVQRSSRAHRDRA